MARPVGIPVSNMTRLEQAAWESMARDGALRWALGGSERGWLAELERRCRELRGWMHERRLDREQVLEREAVGRAE